MHPKTFRQQNTHRNGPQQDASVRTHPGPKRAQPLAHMMTEYQERFLAPHCYKAMVTTTTRNDPYHPMKANGADMTTFRSVYVTKKKIKNPPKPPKPTLQPKGQQKTLSDPHNPSRSKAAKADDYTSVYKNDFRAWKVNKRQPFKLTDSLKVNQGLFVPSTASKGRHLRKNSAAVSFEAVPKVREPELFHSITSYKSDYVAHAVQPRTRREKPANRADRGVLSEPVVSLKPQVTWDGKQKRSDNASQQSKSWSLETKFRGQDKASPPADHDTVMSTTHSDYTAHQCQRTKPILLSMQTREKSNEPFQTTTTMKEDYKAWNKPRRFPAVNKEDPDGLKKTNFLLCTHATAESCKTNQKSFDPQPKLSETAVCNSIRNVTQKPPPPAQNGVFSGFECISNGTEESWRYWTTSLNRGETWADDDACEEPSEGRPNNQLHGF